MVCHEWHNEYGIYIVEELVVRSILTAVQIGSLISWGLGHIHSEKLHSYQASLSRLPPVRS